MELQRSKSQPEHKARRHQSVGERKLALLQDVDNLKNKLRYEENVHRALKRALNRPLGALPRFPPCLPQYTLELLAEVAVLEEEVVRLEEQIVNIRKGIYQEIVYISSITSAENSTYLFNEFSIISSKKKHSRSLSQTELNSRSFLARPSPSLSKGVTFRKFVLFENASDQARRYFERLTNGKKPHGEPAYACENGWLKDDQSCTNSNKDNLYPEPEQITISNRNVKIEANKMSEDILKCLIRIFLKISSSKVKTMDLESFSPSAARLFRENITGSQFRDPYCTFPDIKKRDIGVYKHLHVTEARSVDLNRKKNVSFLILKLKLLLDKLASVKLDSLTHQQKLAFWINIYNSSMMNVYLEHGIPDSPDMIVALMQKATITVGGYVLNALMIEHLILRPPYHLKNSFSKSAHNNEMEVFRTFGLEWSEPLVTFALSCGSWFSPAVRLYTASRIDTELETAKRDYLQAAIGISSTNKLIIPKLLCWYVLDFAKDLDALLDWICLQLPDGLRKRAVKYVERRGKEPLSNLLQVMPYNFSFRYLIDRRNIKPSSLESSRSNIVYQYIRKKNTSSYSKNLES